LMNRKFSWKNLPKPFFALAPMEDVTDTVFRQIVASCGRPDVMFTEFTNVEGLASEKGHSKVVHRLDYQEIEKPLIAQIWGITPEHYYIASKLALEKGFDGLDINMGCPVKKIIAKGACSALIQNHNLANEIIQAAKEGGEGLEISVKTRIGFDKIDTENWIGNLLNQNLDALTVHTRTVKDLSKVPARHEELTKVMELKKSLNKNTIIVANGDIESRQMGLELASDYKIDGLMIGRGIFKNPWIFSKEINLSEITPKERILKLKEHLILFHKTWGNNKNLSIMKKFFKVYLSNFEGSSKIKSELTELNQIDEILEYLNKYVN